MANIADLQQRPDHMIYGFYIFDQQGGLLYRALSVIFLQLLRKKSQVLRNGIQTNELRAELDQLQSYQRLGKQENMTEDERLSSFCKIAHRVVNFFDGSETIYIILDRADRCCEFKKGVDQRKELLKMLVQIVEAARCKLRVLVVINGGQWNVEQREDELGIKMRERVVVHIAEQGYCT